MIVIKLPAWVVMIGDKEWKALQAHLARVNGLQKAGATYPDRQYLAHAYLKGFLNNHRN